MTEHHRRTITTVVIGLALAGVVTYALTRTESREHFCPLVGWIIDPEDVVEAGPLRLVYSPRDADDPCGPHAYVYLEDHDVDGVVTSDCVFFEVGNPPVAADPQPEVPCP